MNQTATYKNNGKTAIIMINGIRFERKVIKEDGGRIQVRAPHANMWYSRSSIVKIY